MPVARLFVEGKLDAEILGVVCNGSPEVQRRGTKTSIKPDCRNYRQDNRVNAVYIRDRDFDFEPPEQPDTPFEDARDTEGRVFGWRWSRHEIENYMLDPLLLAEVFPGADVDWESELQAAANHLLWYQAARWTIGQIRSRIPRTYKLNTRPHNLDDYRLPSDVSEQCCQRWCLESIAEFFGNISAVLNETNVADQLEAYERRLKECVDQPREILRWWSGKDLFAQLPDHVFKSTGTLNSKTLLNTIRDWMRSDGEIVCSILLEFDKLRKNLRR